MVKKGRFKNTPDYRIKDIQSRIYGRCPRPRNRYPYCIVWTTIRPVSWFFPFVGHVGISTSQGIIYDYPTSFVVLEDNMAYGCPMKIWELDPNNAVCDWDRAIYYTAEIFRKREFNVCNQNCYSMVVHALNRMDYAGVHWTGLKLCTAMIIFSEYVDYASCVKNLLPCTFFILVKITVILIIIIIVSMYNHWALITLEIKAPLN